MPAFRGKLTHLKAPNVDIRLTGFGIQEGYSTGWSGTAVIMAADRNGQLTAGSMMSAVMASGVVAGTPMNLKLEPAASEFEGMNVRSWPCVVKALKPFPIDEFRAGCNIELIDPISHMADQPIWGAYRDASAAEIIGGVLSLASGGDGKPTLSPLLPRLTTINIVAAYRDALERIPYAIAAGQSLGDWLADFLAMLGLRVELLGFEDGQIRLTITDAKPMRPPLGMAVVTADGEDPPPADYVGPILIQAHSAFPGTPLRGALLDDPTKGTPRPLVTHGAVGTVLSDSGLSVDEATARVVQAAKGTFTEMFLLTAMSRQPRLRPGETVNLSRPMHGIPAWQVASISHWLRGERYDNDATLMRGDMPWHPDLPINGPPVYVSAVVNGGVDFDFHEPVPRDRLGRIKVTFPFTPVAAPDEHQANEREVADRNEDGRVTLADFETQQIERYRNDEARWEAMKARYLAGDFNDPYPDRENSELTEDEQAERDDRLANRQSILEYMAFQRANRDRDMDGTISARDTLISDGLARALGDNDERQRVINAWSALAEAGEDDGQDDEDLTEEEIERARINELAEEYGRLFGDSEDDLSDEVLAARQDAEEQSDRWPARIPLPVVAPMAGALHGFITAHRHGDTCRVAVHNAFNAEIVGFQYRDDRRINADLSRSVAGLVVEHNYGEAWSGLVFRRTEELEASREEEDAQADEDVQEDESQEEESQEEEESVDAREAAYNTPGKYDVDVEEEPQGRRQGGAGTPEDNPQDAQSDSLDDAPETPPEDLQEEDEQPPVENSPTPQSDATPGDAPQSPEQNVQGGNQQSPGGPQSPQGGGAPQGGQSGTPFGGGGVPGGPSDPPFGGGGQQGGAPPI